MFSPYFSGSLKSNKVLIFCGPGNNGGDGLVCGRHLSLMGYAPSIVYPKRTDKELYKNLTHQCTAMDIHIYDTSADAETANGQFALIVDALFGFSFRPPVRPEFADIMATMRQTSLPLVR